MQMHKQSTQFNPSQYICKKPTNIKKTVAHKRGHKAMTYVNMYCRCGIKHENNQSLNHNKTIKSNLKFISTSCKILPFFVIADLTLLSLSGRYT